MRRSSKSGAVWEFCRTLVISSKDGEPYLKRLRIVQTPWFGVYLHRIYREDFDKHCHDHPWPFLSFIVRGGYIERYYYSYSDTNSRSVRPRDTGKISSWRFLSVHSHPLNKAHKILFVKPRTVTLVLCGRRQREWGFWTEDGLVLWKPYLAAQGHPQANS